MSERNGNVTQPAELDRVSLRKAIKNEYKEVAENPNKGFHFHTGRKLTQIVGYRDEWLLGIPERAIESFAGTGNPFTMGELAPGEKVVDIGSGGGIDALIAANMVGSNGYVIGVDMTPAMLARARLAAQDSNTQNLEFKKAYMENLPVTDTWADVVISNGVFNLAPDKAKVLSEMFRILRSGGRLQIADIMVDKKVPEGAKRNIDLWTG